MLVLFLSLPVYAGTTARVSVPPGTVSATVLIIGQNNAGNITSQTSSSFCPSGNTVTVSLPNNTSTTTFSGQAIFQDGSGNVIGVTQVYNDDGGGSGSGHLPPN